LANAPEGIIAQAQGVTEDQLVHHAMRDDYDCSLSVTGHD
jgi:hypothetical protein